MPWGDGTGPRGLGPMTGRATGYCAGYPMPGYMNPMPGRGLGIGWGRWGRGRGWRNWYYATGLPGWAHFGYAPAWGVSPLGASAPYPPPATGTQEAEFLRAQASGLERQLQTINQRVAELEGAAETEGEES